MTLEQFQQYIQVLLMQMITLELGAVIQTAMSEFHWHISIWLLLLQIPATYGGNQMRSQRLYLRRPA